MSDVIDRADVEPKELHYRLTGDYGSGKYGVVSASYYPYSWGLGIEFDTEHNNGCWADYAIRRSLTIQLGPIILCVQRFRNRGMVEIYVEDDDA